MLRNLEAKGVKLNWITPPPSGIKRIAIMIPQYNEYSNGGLDQRLEYFNGLAGEFKDILDLIIIDDGSSDDSLDRMQLYLNNNTCYFLLASVAPNANKVGALFIVTMAIRHEWVVLSDFDTDLKGIERLSYVLKNLEKDDSFMGCYFRMLPHEGKNKVFLFQQLEYALLRALYKFHGKENSVMVMPGAGSCYKRDTLITIYEKHSGLRNGEDREACIIGLKLGLKTKYVKDIIALTRPPLTFKALVRQRVRWNLGYIETFSKEWDYYKTQISKMSRIGLRTIFDILIITLLVFLPFLFLVSVFNVYYLIILLSIIYASTSVWCLCLWGLAPEEMGEIKHNKIGAVLVYPLIKVTIDYLGWMGALIKISQRFINIYLDKTKIRVHKPQLDKSLINTVPNSKFQDN